MQSVGMYGTALLSARNSVVKACRHRAIQFINSPETFTWSIFNKANVNIHINKSSQLYPVAQNHQILKFSTSYQGEKNSEEVLVYFGPLQNRIKWVKAFSLGCSMLAFAAQPLVLYDLFKINVGVCIITGVVSTIFLSTPFMLNYITKRYVIELYFNPETKVFTAKTLNIVNQVKEIQFTAEDVITPDLPGMLSSFIVKKTPLFVDANEVEDPDAYSHMMGYDKPLDLLIHDITEKNMSEEVIKK